ncbi:LruC domain-containing protein [Photobacterium sp. MCCC 1A19761]|uniref:LruC domain-containing protein n=1 Tax=Photobacterium sp. MCCC 1A19761 TaxID=3115000 RepID=UPI00307EED4F
MKKHVWFWLCGLWLSPVVWAEPVSVLLTDTIKNGQGNINLFDLKHSTAALTPAELEAFRLAHNGALVLAVDINEAASGTEKASTQGVTISAVQLTIVSGGNSYTFTDFSTPTSSLLASAGQTERQSYFTIIGQTGSSLITPNADSELNGTSFDGLLTIPVDMALDQAVSATLVVSLLETNTQLGDPEAFYDYTAGFEDLALISVEDAQYLADLAPGQEEAPLVITQNQVQNTSESWVYYPAADDYYIAAYEDNYPAKNDYDFNDLVVGYRVGYGMTGEDVNSLIVYGYIIARGSDYTHDWYLHIGLPESTSGTGTVNLFKPGTAEQESGYPKSFSQNGSFDQRLLTGTKALMQIPGKAFANTEAEEPLVQGHKFSVVVDFETPLKVSDIALPPYDPYLYVPGTGYEIHLSEQASRLAFSVNNAETAGGFKNAQGYPFAVIIPDDWQPPLEYVDLGEAYSNFLGYVLNDGVEATPWYQAPTTNKVRGIGKSFWKWD